MSDVQQAQLDHLFSMQNKALSLLFTDADLEKSLSNMCSLLESALNNNKAKAIITLKQDKKLFRYSALSHDTKEPISEKPSISSPILCQTQRELGSLDLYFNASHTPDAYQSAVIQHFAQFAAAYIEKHQSQQEQQTLVQSIKESNNRMLALSRLIPDLMFVLSSDGIIEDLFGGKHSLLLMAQSEFMGKKYDAVLPPDVSSKVDFGLERALTSGKIQIIHYSLDLPIGKTDFEGRIIPAEKNHKTQKQRLLYMARDITQQNKDKEKIEQLAYYDALTQLANRSLLLNALEAKLALAAENQLFGALIFVDLDDFKKINDSLGHSIGDEFLIMVGLRLKQTMPDSATLARIGGDEFVILLDELSYQKEEIQNHAQALTKLLIENNKEPFYYNKVAYQLGSSIGITVFDGKQSATADQVLQQADMCMYQAKKMGGDQLVIYSDQFTDFAARRFQIESDIQKGIKNQSFHAHFQPQISPSGQIISAEALIRWEIDGQNLAHPADFIPIAENSGLINQLQTVILEQSCQLIQQVDCLLGHQDFTLSINISANQLRTKLGHLLLQTIIKYGLEPKRFKLEITESLLLERSQIVIKQIETLQSMGFQFSIDDFGMGYSSLAYLHELPINELKIDKAFIDESGNTVKQRPIIKAITSMAKELSLDVVIEGVETEQQNQMLQGLKFTALQGFLFSKPLPAQTFIEIIKSQLETV